MNSEKVEIDLVETVRQIDPGKLAEITKSISDAAVDLAMTMIPDQPPLPEPVGLRKIHWIDFTNKLFHIFQRCFSERLSAEERTGLFGVWKTHLPYAYNIPVVERWFEQENWMDTCPITFEKLQEMTCTWIDMVDDENENEFVKSVEEYELHLGTVTEVAESLGYIR